MLDRFQFKKTCQKRGLKEGCEVFILSRVDTKTSGGLHGGPKGRITHRRCRLDFSNSSLSSTFTKSFEFSPRTLPFSSTPRDVLHTQDENIHPQDVWLFGRWDEERNQFNMKT